MALACKINSILTGACIQFKNVAVCMQELLRMRTNSFSFILNDGIRRVQAVKYSGLPAESFRSQLLI
jgi:hypothetical protein